MCYNGTMPPKPSPWEPRFWAKVEKTDACWLWKGHTANGYGRFRPGSGGRPQSAAAHRIAYTLLIGPPPPGLDLDHLCRVRHCVRPDHLEPVSRSENLRRGDTDHWGWNRTKEFCVAGHPLAGDNLYSRPDRPNRRECRICRLEATRRTRARKKRGR